MLCNAVQLNASLRQMREHYLSEHKFGRDWISEYTLAIDESRYLAT